MKRLILLIAIILLNKISNAQVVLNFDQREAKGIRSSQLDSIYKSGTHADSTLAVFASNPEKYYEIYTKMLQGFGKHLTENNFIWEKPTNGFNRIYFNENGKVDYYLYSFRPGQISKEKEMEFEKLLKEYFNTYQFPLPTKEKFAQCSPVTYSPKK